MEPLKKPVFFNKKVLQNLPSICFASCGIFSIFLPFASWKLKMILFFLAILASFIFMVKKYLETIDLFYDHYSTLDTSWKDLAKNYITLSNQLDHASNKIILQDKRLNEYRLVLEHVLFAIQQGFVPANQYERDYLNNFIRTLIQNKASLYHLEIERMNHKES